jgi:adenylate cyclase
VDLAARISGLARPAQVLMSSGVADSARQHLDAGAFDPPILWRTYGGYSFKGFDEPLEIREAGLEGVAPFEAPAASEKAKPARPPGSSATKRRTLLVGSIVTTFAVLAAGAVYLARPPAEGAVFALPSGPKVAVLPFTNMSGDPEQEYFSDGITEDIITSLSRFREMFVIARNSTFRYKGESVDVRELRRELGARYVVEGSVRRTGTRLRVTVQLLDAEDGTHLWADTYDRELSASDIFAVQDEITEQVVSTIASNFGVISRARFAEIKGKPTDSLDAYECVLHVVAYYAGGHDAEGHGRARACLERAVNSDPGYADAWAWLSMVYSDQHAFNYDVRSDSLGRAMEAAQKAVEADPALQFAHVALAQVYFHRHELDGFFAEADRAIALNPNNAVVLAALGDRLYWAGDPRGIRLVRKAAQLDPFLPTVFNIPIAMDHFERGEYEEALAAARKIATPGAFWPEVHLAAIYGELGRQREARSALEELHRLYPGFTTETLGEEFQKWNLSEERLRLWVAALRKAGLP